MLPGDPHQGVLMVARDIVIAGRELLPLGLRDLAQMAVAAHRLADAGGIEVRSPAAGTALVELHVPARDDQERFVKPQAAADAMLGSHRPGMLDRLPELCQHIANLVVVDLSPAGLSHLHQ